jgi:soluble lytic murein transglycosylase-like protein
MSMMLRILIAIGIWLCLSIAVAAPQIPTAASAYKRVVVREAHQAFGLDAPVAVLAAQLHQESGWRADAHSGAGALGLAQFMPGTAQDIARRHPDACAPANPFNADWAIRCQQRYMGELVSATAPWPAGGTLSECSRWAMALASYNGGSGWTTRDRYRAQATGHDPNVWFGVVENTPDPRRAARFVRENRGYPTRILLVIAPAYVDAGWGRAVACWRTA